MEKQINELIEKYKLSQKEHNIVLELLKKDLFVDKIAEKIHQLCSLLVNLDVEKQHL